MPKVPTYKKIRQATAGVIRRRGLAYLRRDRARTNKRRTRNVRTYLRNPGRYDMFGVDTKKYRAQRKRAHARRRRPVRR